MEKEKWERIAEFDMKSLIEIFPEIVQVSFARNRDVTHILLESGKRCEVTGLELFDKDYEAVIEMIRKKILDVKKIKLQPDSH